MLTAIYAINKNLHEVKSNLEANFAIMYELFLENHMVLNPGICHYMLIGNQDQLDKINLKGTVIASSNDAKLFGMLIDNKLSFGVQMKSLC